MNSEQGLDAQPPVASRHAFPKGLAIGAGKLVVLLVFSAAIGYCHLRQLRENDAWVAHIHEVLEALGGVLSTINDSETGQRGYLITGEDRYLEPYHAAVTALPGKVQRLKYLMEDNPRQQAHIPLLEKRISAKLQELDRTIAVRKKDPPAARQIVLTGEGQNLMDAIRAQVHDMQKEERDLLAVRERQSRQSFLVAVLTGLFTLALALAMVGVFVYFLQRHFSDRHKAEEQRARSAAEILRQKELLAVTLASIDDGVIVTDTRGRVTFLNGEAERLFVVDDNATNRRILEETLRSWRMIPAAAAGAEEAFVLLQRAREAGEPYRLVVTDAHMPRIDGFTFAQQIKQDPAIGGTVIMMLTSGDRPEDIARCGQLGIAAYMLKPVKQSELLEAIELALGVTAPREELLAMAARQPHPVRSLHVLLAEDSLVNQKLAVALLEGQGHTVTLVNNGKEAVAATGVRKFDLLLNEKEAHATGAVVYGEFHTRGHAVLDYQDHARRFAWTSMMTRTMQITGHQGKPAPG